MSKSEILSIGLGTLFLVLSYIVTFPLFSIIFRFKIMEKIRPNHKENRGTKAKDVFGLFKKIKHPIRVLLMVGIFSFLVQLNHLTKPYAHYVSLVTSNLIILILVWLANSTVDYFYERLIGKFKSKIKIDFYLGSNIVKGAIATFGLLLLLQNWGFDIKAIWAGLGIGGIALAMAGKNLAENLLGGLTLILDHPFVVGETCLVDGSRGKVIEIGLRSTKFLTWDMSIVTIPNGVLVQKNILNYSRRKKYLFFEKVEIRYQTTMEQMRGIISDIKKSIHDFEHIYNEDYRVNFVNFDDYSLDIEVFFYFKTRDYYQYLDYKQDFLFEINRIIKKNGAHMAFPTQSIYLEKK